MSIRFAPRARAAAVPLLAVMLLCGCSRAADTSATSTTTNATAAAAVSAPAATAAARPAAAAPADAQTNPPGDIPDTQAFVTYSSPDGYSVFVPEGWSRTVSGKTATFTSHYDGESVTRRRSGPPGPKTYVTSSPPDPVTGKSIKLEHERHVYRHGTVEAILDLWAPQGSDNADQWKKIAQSFRWK